MELEQSIDQKHADLEDKIQLLMNANSGSNSGSNTGSNYGMGGMPEPVNVSAPKQTIMRRVSVNNRAFDQNSTSMDGSSETEIRSSEPAATPPPVAPIPVMEQKKSVRAGKQMWL